MSASRKVPLAAKLLDASATRINDLSFALNVWVDVANKWQDQAEARKRALDAMTIQCRDLSKQVRMLKRVLLASGIVSAVMTVAAVAGWMR